MDMHPANQQTPRDAAQGPLQIVIAIAVRVPLVFPVRKRMAGRGDGGEVVLRRFGGDSGTEAFQLFPRFADIGADLRADLHLALQEFRAELSLQRGGASLHQRLRRFGQGEAVAVDEEVFLLHPHSEIRFRRHRSPP